jgi:non-specific serine/threonine protein kinase
MNQGDYVRALPEYRTAIPLLRDVEPDNVALRDSMRMDLVGALTQTGALAEARAEGEALIAEIRTRTDDNGLVVAFARAALARTYTLEGDTARAEIELIDAQRTIVRLLGEDHTRNLMVLSDLFDVAMKRHDWQAAIDYARRVHEGFRARLGDEHNVSDLTLANWGMALYESGDAPGAQAKLRPAQQRLAARLTAANPQAQVAAFWLAAALLESGDDIDAAARLVDGLDAKSLEAAGADGLWQARLDALRGLVLVRRGDPDAARPMLRGAVERLGGNAAGSGRLLERARAAITP